MPVGVLKSLARLIRLMREVPMEALTAINGVLSASWWSLSFLVFDHSGEYRYPPFLIGVGIVGLCCVPLYIVRNDEVGWHGFAYVLAYTLLVLSALSNVELLASK